MHLCGLRHKSNVCPLLVSRSRGIELCSIMRLQDPRRLHDCVKEESGVYLSTLRPLIPFRERFQQIRRTRLMREAWSRMDSNPNLIYVFHSTRSQASFS